MKQTTFFISCILMAASSACTENIEQENPEPETTGITEVTNLTPAFIGNISGVKPGDKLEKGGTFTLTLTPGEILASGFSAAHMEHIHIHLGDKVFMPSFPKTSEEYIQNLQMEIPVPEAASEIIVAYSVQQKLSADGFTMKLESNKDNVELYGVSPEMKYKYFDCYLRTPDAYTIENVEFRTGNGEWTDINSVTGCRFARSESLDWVYEVSVRPEYKDITGDITLRVKGSQHARYKIIWKNTEYIKTDIPEEYEQNNLPEESIDGEEVVASFWTKDGYYLDGVSTNIDGLFPECISRAYVRFRMPASDVEINLNFREKIPVKYESSEHILSAQIYDKEDIYYGVPTNVAIPGEYIYLFANAEKDYKPSVARNEKGESFKFVTYGSGIDQYGYYAKIKIPADAASSTVSAEASRAYTVSGDSGIVLDKGTLYIPGENVSFQVFVPSGKTIKEITVKQNDGISVECSMDNTYGSFIMPENDVYVDIAFKNIESDNMAHISATYGEDYRVYSQTNPYYQKITEDGFDVPIGTALYINIADDYGMPFWVGIKIGENISYFEAEVDPDFGEATFGKSFIISANTVIKVGGSKESVSF